MTSEIEHSKQRHVQQQQRKTADRRAHLQQQTQQSGQTAAGRASFQNLLQQQMQRPVVQEPVVSQPRDEGDDPRPQAQQKKPLPKKFQERLATAQSASQNSRKKPAQDKPQQAPKQTKNEDSESADKSERRAADEAQSQDETLQHARIEGQRHQKDSQRDSGQQSQKDSSQDSAQDQGSSGGQSSGGEHHGSGQGHSGQRDQGRQSTDPMDTLKDPKAGTLNVTSPLQVSQRIALSATHSPLARLPQALLDQLVHYARVITRPGSDPVLEVTLRQEVFAGLRLRMTLQNGRLSVELISHDPQVVQLLTTHRPSLSQALEEKGFSLRTIDVKVA